jgi:fibronectin type 3 domain-containing protein
MVAVRAWGRKGRPAAWSNLVAFRVAAPLEQPSGLKAEATAAGVRLAWDGARGATFRVLRNEADLAVAEKPEYVDATAQYGQSYRYAVQAVLKTGESVAESEVSDSVSITPEDRFAPAVPAGLVAVAGVRSVALNWERSREPDLKGYYLYRSVEGGPFQRVGGLLEVPAASDPGIEPGRRYRYSVAAVDQRDNESARSEPLEVAP